MSEAALSKDLRKFAFVRSKKTGLCWNTKRLNAVFASLLTQSKIDNMSATIKKKDLVEVEELEMDYCPLEC